MTLPQNVKDAADAADEAAKIASNDSEGVAQWNLIRAHPPAQAAQSVDIKAIREVIESHINEAKKLRHDPESQDYLYEQADKLTAALQEKGNG